jgi:Polyketide cyclase / dehydrase and lipid transport
MKSCALALMCLFFAAPAAAEVVDSTPHGFAVRNVVVIAANPVRVYNTAVEMVGRWWNPAHSHSKNSSNLTLEPRPGGCLCERLPVGGVVHLTTVYAAAPQEIRFTGALGPLQQTGVAGSMIWKLSETDGGTQFEWRYTVGGYMPGGLAAIASAVDGVLMDQLQRLKRFVETGRVE